MNAYTQRAGFLAAMAIAACSPGSERPGTDAAGQDTAASPESRRMASATATLRDASGRELGTLTLTESGSGIAVAGRLQGLAPGEHGLHLHQTGRCEPAFSAAGSHWNPTDRQHGSANPQGPHAGDLPNVTIGSDSAGSVEGTTAAGSLFGELPLLDADGAAVIVHAGRDDYSSQPSGNAGDPVACGVIEAAGADPADSLR
ncbi:MAG TPA: superoxide dismutase family protein [Gemmatimonadales bacterium]